MKRILFLIFLSFGISAFSQNSRVDAFSVSYYKKTVKVESYKPNITLSISYLDDINYLSTLSLRRRDGFYGFQDYIFTVYVGNIRIKDFEICGDTVFFCGTYGFLNQDSYPEAVIGFFNIDTLFNAYWDTHSGWQHHPENIYIQKGFDTDYSGYVKSLDKLTSYMDEYGKRHVVCIGQAETNAEDMVMRDCMVDFSNDGTIWSYICGVLAHTDTNSLEAVAFVPGMLDDFVVTAGFEIDSCLSLRLFNPSNVFATPLSNKVQVFNDFSATDLHRWKMKDLEISPEQEGHFVTATIWNNPINIGLSKNSIHLAKFNTTGLYNSYPGSMSWSRKLYFTNNLISIMAIHGLVSNLRNESYGLILEAWQPSFKAINHSYFFELDGTMENILYNLRANGYGNIADLNLRGLDLYENGNKYIMSGFGLPDNYHKIIHLTETSHQASSCLPAVQSIIKKMEPVKCKEKISVFRTRGGRVEIVSLSTAFDHSGRFQICPTSDESEE